MIKPYKNENINLKAFQNICWWKDKNIYCYYNSKSINFKKLIGYITREKAQKKRRISKIKIIMQI
jgi:hypothetical protein